MKMSIQTNLSLVQKRMANLHKKQVPFAMSQALNDAAFETRNKIVKDTFPRAFDVKNTRFPSVAIRVLKKASKRDLVAIVGDALGKDYLLRHATGGIKRPRGRHIAIPTRHVRRLQSGRVAASQKPTVLLGGKGFRTTTSGGQEVIAVRKGRGVNKKQVVMYVLENSVRIDKSFDFYEDARRTAGPAFRKNFNKRLRQAIRTAR